jgi:1-phosphofructokinase
LSKGEGTKINKVVCVTLNTAIDHIIDVDTLDAGSTIRASHSQLVPAGKGVDVAVGVATFGGHAVATGFIGENSREVFASLRAERVELMFIEVPGSTRINVTVFERKVLRETHLQTVGYEISGADVEQFYIALERNVASGDVVVIGGSLPPGSPNGLMAELVTLCRTLGAYVILDSSGTALLDGLRAGPHMVKPNLLELAQIVGHAVDDSDSGIPRAVQECRFFGSARVVVSRGYRGIVVIEDGQAWKAWLNNNNNGKTAGVGSGDALVAAFAFSILKNHTLDHAMRLGVACGAANLLTKLPGRFRSTDVEELLPLANVHRIA